MLKFTRKTRQAFEAKLRELGEPSLVGNVKNKSLGEVFDYQGFWSGVEYRIYYVNGSFEGRPKWKN